MISSEHAERLGIVEWFRPGDHQRVEVVARRLAQLGIRHLRTHVSSADYHGDGSGWYDWMLRRLGGEFELLPCLHYTPQGFSETARTSSAPRYQLDFAEFVDEVIDRYGARFDSIELWNKPHHLLEWNWRQDVGWDKFSEMIREAAQAVQQCGKRAVLSGPCPTDPTWLTLMGQAGVLGAVDVIGVHGFPGTWDSVVAGVWPGWAAMVEAVTTATLPFNPDLEFWITETGYSTWRYDGANQAQAFLDALDAPASRMYWSALQDLDMSVAVQEGRNSDLRYYHLGLDDVRGQPKLLGRIMSDGVSEVGKTLSATRRPRMSPVNAVRPVLVTGGAGFIGTNLVDRLASEGHDVLVYDALARPGVERNLQWLAQRHPARVSFEIGDLRDAQAVGEAAANAAAIFHLAGQVAVTTSLVQPLDDFAVNAQGTLQLLDALRLRNPGAPLVFASTNKVYGDLADISLAESNSRYLPRDSEILANGVPETRPLCFHTPYGCSKGAADQYVLDYAQSFGLRTAVLRMSCIYGERQLGTEDQGWVAHFLLRAIAGESLTIYGDGMQVRDVLHVGDAVAAYMAAWERIDDIAGRAYNLGGGASNAVSLLQLIDHIGDLLGRRVGVEFAEWRPGDQRYFVADTRAVTRDLGLAAPLGWRSGVARLAEWFGTITDPSHSSANQRVATV